GRASEARIVRLDSLNWARYGFGSEKHLKTKLREIQALNPLNRRNG
ncbi:MAG: ATP-dependent transcriptional regulator, partial [Paracoccaceae bacterium]